MTRSNENEPPIDATSAARIHLRIGVIVVLIAAALGPIACGSSAGPHDAGTDGLTPDLGSDGAAVADGGGGGGRQGDAADAPDSGAADAPGSDAADAGAAGSADTRDADAPDASGPDASGPDAQRGDTAGPDATPPPDAADGGGPSPEIVFVATYLGGMLTFVVDPTSGRLDPAAGSPYDRGAQLYAVAVHPSGGFVYATDLRGKINGYRVTRGLGTLEPVPGSPLTIGTVAIAAVIDPLGRFLFVGDDESLRIFAIDPTSGALAERTAARFPTGGQPSTLMFHPSGRFLYASFIGIGPAGNGGIRALEVDATAGTLTEVTGSPFAMTGVRGGGMALHPSGKFLYVGSSQLSGFRIDPGTGALDPLAGFPLPGGNSDATAISVAVEPAGHYLYATNSLGTIHGYRIDGSSGMLEGVSRSPFEDRSAPYSVAVDPAGRFVFVGNDVGTLSVYAIDPPTGNLDSVGGSPFTADGLQPEVAVSGG